MNDEKTTELDLSKERDENKIIHVNFRPERARSHAPLRSTSHPATLTPRKPTTHIVMAMVRELDLKKSWYARLLAVLLVLFLSLLVL